MEQQLCPFCGEVKFRRIKSATCGNYKIDWFICFDCDKQMI